MDSVEIPSSNLYYVNSDSKSVEDANHETIMKHDEKKSVCSARDQPRNIIPEQIIFSKNDPPVFDKTLYGTALDPALLTVTSLEDYSDVSSCSETDFGDIFNVSEIKPNQSSEFQDTAVSSDKIELQMDFCQAGSNNAQLASDGTTEIQHYIYRESPETEAERPCGSVDVAGYQVERSILNQSRHSNLGTTGRDSGCTLNAEEQMKEKFLIQTTDYVVTESSENCKDATEITSSCALDLIGAKQNVEVNEKNPIITKSLSVQNDFQLKGINAKREFKNSMSEYELKHDTAPEDDWTISSQEVEHGSFDFLQSCFGLNGLENTKVNQYSGDVSLSGRMTQHSQNSDFNHAQPRLEPVLGTGQTEEATNGGLLKSLVQGTYNSPVSQDLQRQNDSIEEQIKGFAKTERTLDTENRNGASLSSRKLMRRLQPVVLLKAANQNVKDGSVYICSLCQNNKQTLDELIEHHHCEHSKHTLQYCLAFGTCISSGTLAAHLCERKNLWLSDTVLSTPKQMTEKQHAKYLCKYCQKPFIKRSYHQDHEQRHTTITQYRCGSCGLYFPYAKKLNDHKRKVKCLRLILEPNEQSEKSLETDQKSPSTPYFILRVDGCPIGINECFVKLVDIKKRPSTQQINCSICGKSFKLRAQLKVHLRSHTGAKPFKCSECKKVFKYAWNLDKHKKELCSRRTTKHIKHCTSGACPGRFACPTCPRIFRYSYNRTRHMRHRCLKEYIQMGKGKVGNRYKCPMCTETFSQASNRNRHVKKICFEQYKLQRKSSNAKLVSEIVKHEKEVKQVLPTDYFPRYKCKVCPASFAQKSGVYRHMNKHGKPNDVKEPGSESEAPQPQECSSPTFSDVATNGDILCRFCDKGFTSSSFLKNHLQLHVGKKPFHCLECGKNFSKRGHLAAHKNVHKRRIQCSVCKKIMPTLGDLFKHRQKHTKKGMLKCPDCPMQFKFPVFLLRHVATHVKKEAMKKSSPVKKTADEQVKELPFKCGICQKAFVDSKAMSEHCLTHLPNPFTSECPVCKHKFSNRTGLIRHLRLHTGEKPFPCKNCGNRFYRKEHLRFHEVKCNRSHEQPSTSAVAQTQPKCQVRAILKSAKTSKIYTCSYCPHIFTMSGNLVMHERAHLVKNLLPCLKCGKYYKKNKVCGHRKHCNIKASPSTTTGETFNNEKCGNAQKSDCKDANLVVADRMCRTSRVLKKSIKDSFKERCPHCSKRFQFRSYLLRHLQSHLGKQFACKHCSKKYGDEGSWQQHEASCDCELRQHEIKENECVPDLSASGLKECTVLIRGNAEQLKCNFCTKTFAKPRYLRRHILTHTEVKPYSCKTCENCFSRYDHLIYHQTRCRGKKQQLDKEQPVEEEQVGSQANRQPQSDVLECNICSKKFSSQSNLTRHISLLHSTAKPFSCNICATGFTSKDSLKRHGVRANCDMSPVERLEPAKSPSKLNISGQSCRESSKLLQCIEGRYSTKWRFPCEYCPRRFKIQAQLTLHTRLHTGEKPFGCASCDERFIRKDYLKRHLSKCSGNRQGLKVLCDRCGGLFTQEALEIHQTDCIVSLKSPDCPEQKVSISSPSNVKVFSCVICNRRFLLFSQLQQHILTHHRSDGLQPSGILEHEKLSYNLPIKEEPLEDNDAENSQSSQINTDNGHGNAEHSEREKPFECEQCDMRFITNSGLGSHMRTHATIYPLSCNNCNKGFCSKKEQLKHMRKCKGLEATPTEYSAKDAILSESESALNDVLVFNKGSNTTGTGVLQTKFSCKDQDKGNMNKANTALHKYQCSECEQSFTDGLMLISHLEAHGREDQERRLGKSHSCHICGKSFDQASVLQRHVKTQHQETPKYACPECCRNFRYPSDLDMHRSLHDTNRPFVCKTCKLRYWTTKSLSTHQRLSHSASEPLKTVRPTMKVDSLSPIVFTCHPCNKIYSIKKSYMEHLRLKHRSSSTCLDGLKSDVPKHELINKESEGNDTKDVSDDDSDSAPYFPCHVCGKTFLTSESLEDHQRCHLGEKPYECEECGKCFIQLVNLQQHQRSHKSEFQCQMCAKGFVSLFALRKHKQTHLKKRPHRCTKCHLSFTRSSELAEHMISHRDENFPCDLCHKIFSCKSSRAEHRKIHTEAEEELPPLIPPAKQTSSSPPVSISPSLSTVQQYKYRCEICQVRFPDPVQLSEHGCNPAKERPYSCKDCNTHFLHGSHLKKHQLTHQLSGTLSFQCNNCHMSFSHRHHFLTHLQTHGGEETSKSLTDEVKILNTDYLNQDKIYRCPICPESFSQVLELANHLSVHANMCNVCNKTFSTKQQLEKHEQCHLSAATQYECTECGKSFLGSDSFRQHSCVHQKHCSSSSLSATDKKRCLENYSKVLANNEEEEVDVGEDFYHCPTCNKRFPSKITLKEHEKLHEIERPFKCMLCGKSYTRKKHLTRHQQIHNEPDCKHRCSVCDKSFRTPYDLSRHERRHPELQKFSRVVGNHRCDMCYKSFGLLTQLRKHQETHVGQVVYECTECDKAFAFLHLLEEHQQTHKTLTDSSQSHPSSGILFHSPGIE